jgi:hypothetical protein
MPTSTTVAFIAMIATAGLIAINFVQDALIATNQPTAGVRIAFLVIALALSAALPLLGAWGLRGGRRWAPVVVTVVGAWGLALLLTYQDVVSCVSASVGLVAVLAAWLPSARKFAREIRADRKA